MNVLEANIAYVDVSRQIVLLDRRGRRIPKTAPDDAPVVWSPWVARQADLSTWSWPTWSPDGQRIACFRISGGDTRTAHVYVLEARGIRSSEVIELGERLPIYLQWSSDGRYLAVLSQREERLSLSVTWPEDVGREVILGEGSPLFFTWAGANRVAAFVGTGTTGGQICLLDPARPTVGTRLPGIPGNFCAPIWLGDSLMYVARHAGHTALVVGRETDPDLEEIEPVDGLVALVASPDRRHIARAVAPSGDGTPYRHLAVIDAKTREVRPLTDRTCLAFVWCPDGERLVLARVDTTRNLLEWHLVDTRDGSSRHLVDMHPTRDLGFYLRFFEQYAQSHPIVDPTGQYLLVAGGLHGKNELSDTPRLWQVSLEDGKTEDLGEGVFAVYAPA